MRTSRKPHPLLNAVVPHLLQSIGMAGLRLGYAMGPTVDSIAPLSGLAFVIAPLSKSHPNAWISNAPSAGRWSQIGPEATRQTSSEKDVVFPSQRAFVSHEADGTWWRNAMAGLGIGIRAGPRTTERRHSISCPSEPDTARVQRAIITIQRPEAILFDLDGVLADVSESTEQPFDSRPPIWGGHIPEDIEAVKAKAVPTMTGW